MTLCSICKKNPAIVLGLCGGCATINSSTTYNWQDIYQQSDNDIDWRKMVDEIFKQQNADARKKTYQQAREESNQDFFKRWSSQSNNFRERTYSQGATESTQAQSVSISIELLKRIRMLCHPDKHGGSKLSESVTKELNRLLNK